MEYNGLPVYDFVIDGDKLGMTAISLVTKPAIESEFIAFETSKQKPKYVKLGSEYKNTVAGLALIPDKLIYRTEEGTDGYYGMFSCDTIEKIRNKFHKEKNTSEVNLQHDDNNFIDAYLIESYILDTDLRVEEVKAKGIEEACLGAWFVAYKIEDDQAFQDALDGNFTGFSVEVLLNKELKLNNNNKNNKFMNKFNGFLNKFKSLLSELENETVLDEVKLTDAALADGSKNLRYTDVGSPVNYVLVDDAGVETLELVPEGSYILETGETLVVGADSNLVEVQAADAVVEPVQAELAISGDTTTTDMPSDTPVVESDVTAAPAADSDLNKTLAQIFDLTKDGEYYLSISVYEGEVKYGSISSWQTMKLSEEKLSEIAELKSKVTELEAQIVKPIAEPVTIKAEKVEKFNPKGKTNLEIQLHKLGLDNKLGK